MNKCHGTIYHTKVTLILYCIKKKVINNLNLSYSEYFPTGVDNVVRNTLTCEVKQNCQRDGQTAWNQLSASQARSVIKFRVPMLGFPLIIRKKKFNGLFE